MGSRGSSSDKYNSRGNEYTNKLKNKAYAEDVRYRMKRYSDKDITEAIATIKDGIKFNNDKMVENLNRNTPDVSNLNMGLYERNKKLVSDLKEFEYEQKKRKQDHKTIQKMKNN